MNVMLFKLSTLMELIEDRNIVYIAAGTKICESFTYIPE